MAASDPQTPLTELLQGRYAQYTARGGSPETLARETGLHEETIRKYRVGGIPQPQYRGLVLLAMALGISQDELETAALSSCPSYHVLLNRFHLREKGILATRVDDAFLNEMRLKSEHAIRRLMSALREAVEAYKAIGPMGSDWTAERREAIVQASLDAQLIARAALSHLAGDPRFAESDRQVEGAAEVVREAETLGADALEQEPRERDADEPQAG